MWWLEVSYLDIVDLVVVFAEVALGFVLILIDIRLVAASTLDCELVRCLVSLFLNQPTWNFSDFQIL
jgi:hypothetical protein